MTYSIKKKLSARGFTLIELLVVIAIIGVLATVVLASLNTARRKSRDARRVSDIKQLQLALELHFDGAGALNYPLGTATCTAVATAVDGENYGLQILVNGGYIASVPRDPNAPAGSNCYRYTSLIPSVGSARASYHIGAVLEDPSNTALNGDIDCDDGAGTFCGGSVAGVGARVQGLSADCAGAAVPDRCYDARP